MTEWETKRAAELREAQSKAGHLFHEIEEQGLIRAGISESRLNADIYALAEKMYGISTYWHKRIVRAGKNTLLPYAENPPDLTLGEADILFLDLGPVFELQAPHRLFHLRNACFAALRGASRWSLGRVEDI